MQEELGEIIYNVTTHVDWLVHDAWLQWMQDVHIPEVSGTGCFTKHLMVRLLNTDESIGATYAVQYFIADRAKYNEYEQRYAGELREATKSKWGDKIISFRSLMAIVN